MDRDGLPKPDLLTVQLEEADSLQKARRWQDASELYTSLDRDFGADSRVLNGRGLCFRMLLNPAAAIADFTAARGLAHRTGNSNEELTAIVGLIDTYRTANRNPKFTPWTDVKPEDLQQRLYDQAYLHMVEAQDLVKKTAEPSLAKVHAYTNFGLLYKDTGKIPEALDAYTVAVTKARDLVESNPESINFQNKLARALQTYGEALEEEGNLNGAIASQNEALEAYLKVPYEDREQRGIGNARNAKGRIFKRMNRLPEAKANFEEALVGSFKDGKIIDQEVYNNALQGLAQP